VSFTSAPTNFGNRLMVAIELPSLHTSMEPPTILPQDGSFHLTLVARSDNPSAGDLREFARLQYK
jgi:hypothetical protein